MITTLRQTACLHCGGAGLELTVEGQVKCKFCGTVNNLPGIVCPRCECVSAADAEFCDNCHTALSRTCPECYTKNWSGAAQCVSCGRPLDTLDGLIGRLQEDTDSRLHRQQRESVELKALEEQAAERRLEQLRGIDQHREQAQAEALAQRAAHEHQIMTVVFVIAGLVVIAALAVIALGWLH
jgi:hypothetical protein